ncbi:LLM class flavin-dependent oxidoreductase [Paenibacillus sp. GCM10012307]|uniref:LLM class flavin-dependent oxidoreductase n=1 Tax=Paenibacillus roseus TaxID=2798579 RepID=A0A934J504_9BACL|nr:LLM class flavin-dependent oxidoreductase [Paenibacillus roseus]MBJ6361789.1 LLM class flavin-dependent oxidoreductase [Paenibacillus roseus]
MSKQLHLNAFEMNCLGHLAHGLWSHPADQRRHYTDLSFWTNLAKLLERGKFDAVFIADVLGIYDVYGEGKEPAVRNAVQIPANDPSLVIPPMAAVTKHLNFVVTSATTYEHPYAFARRISTLDHLTKGRIAWNIVTSYLPNAAQNFGLDTMIGHDERYDIADEYLEVVYKLWEGSWQEDAVLTDKKNRKYSDPSKVHSIRHKGNYFNVQGPHLSEPSLQRTPVLYQAGTSPRGKVFAARHAEGIFIGGTDTALMKKQIADIRRQAEEQGRDPAQLKFFTGLTPIVGATKEEAQRKLEEFTSYYLHEGGLVHFSSGSGYDLASYAQDYFDGSGNNHVQSAMDRFSKNALNPRTVKEIIASLSKIGSMGLVAVGTPEEVADRMEQLVEDVGLDGFNIMQVVSPGTLEDFVDLVVPELQRRGIYRKEYQEGTLREQLFGQGNRLLPASHPAASFRELSVNSS